LSKFHNNYSTVHMKQCYACQWRSQIGAKVPLPPPKFFNRNFGYSCSTSCFCKATW